MIARDDLLEWQEKFDALSLRERALVLAIVLSVVISAVQLLLIDPLLAGQARKEKQINQLQAEVLDVSSRQQILNAELAAGVNRSRERRAQEMEAQLVKLDERIGESLVTMIPPRLMTQVLENVLAQDGELTLLALENLPVESIVKRESGEDAAAEADVDEITTGLYRHGFVLTLQGNYPATVRYFEKLSELPWQFHWDDLRYEVADYPDATITLQVHTVSMSEDWIGV